MFKSRLLSGACSFLYKKLKRSLRAERKKMERYYYNFMMQRLIEITGIMILAIINEIQCNMVVIH